MSAAIGWYGPLIDLSKASSHLGDFVQLLVFVRSSQPIQKYNASHTPTFLKTNIQVGDDSRSYFSISVWQKHMGSIIAAGDVILLQNVKIVKFRDVLEAATVQISSLLVLVHSHELGATKGIDELVAHCQLGETTRTKLGRVVNWVKHTESALWHVQQGKRQAIKNWKTYEEKKSRRCLSISEALRLNNSCNANFRACIGEIFLPFISRSTEIEKENLFLSKRLSMMDKCNIVEDLISTGCKLCGSSMGSRSVPEQDKIPLYCQKSSKYQHDISLIYKPFLLYVWDQSGQLPLLVMNKAAEILFGNLSAESVYTCCQEGVKHVADSEHDSELHNAELKSGCHAENSIRRSLTNQNKKLKTVNSYRDRKKPDFCGIWLILIKVLLQQSNNSSFLFEIAVDGEKDIENGRFELVTLKMPC